MKDNEPLKARVGAEQMLSSPRGQIIDARTKMHEDDVMRELITFSHRGAGIPQRMWPGIVRWVVHGTRPGDFLWAVICNNLSRSCVYADDENLGLLQQYVSFFYNRAPGACWGSEQRAIDWEGLGGLSGMEKGR